MQNMEKYENTNPGFLDTIYCCLGRVNEFKPLVRTFAGVKDLENIVC